MAQIVYDGTDASWSCQCAIIPSKGKDPIIFNSVNSKLGASSSAVKQKLLNFSGKQVGTYSAYCQKLSASEYPEMKTPEGAVVQGQMCYYLNDRASFDKDGTLVIGNHMHQRIETVSPGNLHFVIQRNYTAVDRDTFYVVRAVTELGEEGSPSDISVMVSCHADEAPVLKIPVAMKEKDQDAQTVSAGDSNTDAGVEYALPPEVIETEHEVTSLRLYRAAGGTTGSDFLFVDEIPISGEDSENIWYDEDGGYIFYRDVKSDEELNEVMPKFGEVPEKLGGICGMSGGFIAAFKGKDIYFSEPYLPYCFPWEYSQSVPFDIVGMAVRSNYLYVMTTGPLYAFVGDHPEAILPLAMRFDVPCISRKSIAHVQGNIIYAGTTGLVMIGNNGPAVFSDKLYTLEQYKNLKFENCICAGEYDGKYIAVFKDRALVFDFADGQITHTTLDKTAFTSSEYEYSETWASYRQNFVKKNTPYGETMITQSFDEDEAALNSVWRSKEYVFPRPIAFTSARVNFEDPASKVHIRLYAEGVLVYDSSLEENAPKGIPCGKAFRLPVIRRECHWSVEVCGSTDITSVELAESMAEL